MVLAFDSTGSFAKAVYGDASSQHAGQNGAIATSNPSSTTMKGGRHRQQRSRRQNKKQRHSKKQRQSKRQRQSRRQRGGK